MSMSFEEQLGLKVVRGRLANHLVPCHNSHKLLSVVAMFKDAPDNPETTLEAAYDAFVRECRLCDSQGES